MGNFFSRPSQSDLFEAVDRNDLNMVERCLQQGTDIDINARDAHGWTALMNACFQIHVHDEIVERLLAAGADVNIQDDQGRTAATLTMLRNNHACLLRLLQVPGFDLDIQDTGYWRLNRVFAEVTSYWTLDRVLAEVRNFVNTKMAEEGAVMSMVQFAQQKGWSDDLIDLLRDMESWSTS